MFNVQSWLPKIQKGHVYDVNNVFEYDNKLLMKKLRKKIMSYGYNLSKIF